MRVNIIGAGPAGLALGIFIKQLHAQIDVSVFDAKGPEQIKIPVSLPPHVLPKLKQLLGKKYETFLGCHQPSFGSASCWELDDVAYNDFLLTPEGRGIHLQRPLFDNQLAEQAIALGVEIHYHYKLTQVSEKDRWLLTFLHDEQQIEIASDFVVDASGQVAVFANQIGVVRNEVDKLFFMSVLINNPNEVVNHSCIEAVENGWWYTAPQHDGKALLSFATDIINHKNNDFSDIATFLGQLNHTVWLKNQLPPTIELSKSPRVDLARTAMLSVVRGERWLAIGDAASSYDPISSAGIGKALFQAETAARAIIEKLLNDDEIVLNDYQYQVRADFMQFIAIRNRFYQNQRFRDCDFWLRRFS